MKKTILNGQVLSEKEMKEVKGGTPYQVEAELIEKGKWKYCPACAYAFTEEELDSLKAGNEVKCRKCKGVITLV